MVILESCPKLWKMQFPSPKPLASSTYGLTPSVSISRMIKTKPNRLIECGVSTVVLTLPLLPCQVLLQMQDCQVLVVLRPTLSSLVISKGEGS